MFIFIRSGLPGAFITIFCAYLLPSMISEEYPLEFLNMFGIFSVVNFALFIEKIGILRFTYLLVQFLQYLWDIKIKNNIIMNKINLQREKNHQKLDQNEVKDEFLDQTSENENINLITFSDTDKTNSSKLFCCIEYLKYFLSTTLTTSCFAFVIYCIVKGYSSFNSTVLVQFVVAISSLFIIFYYEGDFSSLLLLFVITIVCTVIYNSDIYLS